MGQYEDFITILREIFKIEQDLISDDTNPDDIENWNSITHLKLIDRLEKYFNIKIDVEDITEMDTFGSIKTILKKYRVNL